MGNHSIDNTQNTEDYDYLQSYFNTNNIYKIQYISESFSPRRFDVFKSFLRKNTENYVLIPNKSCIVMPGPKRNKSENPPGLVIAYNSGYIISIGNRPETVGIDNTNENLIPYADWVRKKFRSHQCEPTCKSLDNTRLLNVLGRVYLPQNVEIFLEELHDFLVTNFPSWKVIYDPEIAPFMVICRLWNKKPTRSKLFMPELTKKRFRWPSQNAIKEFRLRDNALRKQKDSISFMRSIMILGPKHIVAHKVESRQELVKAIEEFLPLLLCFIDSPEKRWNENSRNTT